MPAVLKTTRRLSPCDITPLSNAPTAKAEWGALSKFVQVTASPTKTVTLGGLKLKSWIATAAGAALAASGGARTKVARNAVSHRADRGVMTRTIPAVPAATSAPFVALGRDAARLGITLSAAQLALCERYAEELIERNRSINLTAITAPADIATKHFLDSFTALAARRWTGAEQIVDVGSGAGFPGLALRVALPRARVTCVESVGKKARFLEEVTTLLGLTDVDVRNVRAETLAHERGFRAAFDVATARAVATLASCVEYLVPFLRVGGEAIVWKGRIDAELRAAEPALLAVGGALSAVVPTAALGMADRLPGRHLVVIRKTRATPSRYPRTSAEMRKRPWS